MFIIKQLFCAAIAAVMGSTLPIISTVQSTVQKVESVGYAVRAVIPSNQIDKDASYFDLLVAPEQKQTLQVVVLNREEQEIFIAVEANTAFSNENGVIEYSQSTQRDPSMAVDFSTIVTPTQQTAENPEEETTQELVSRFKDELSDSFNGVIVRVPANGKTTVDFSLSVPKDGFTGEVLGGLMFTKLNQNNTAGSAGVTINNIYRYVIGMRLRENQDFIAPSFELASAELKNAETSALIINLRNTSPAITHGIVLETSVYSGNSNTPLLKFDHSQISMAPNSAMPFSISLADQKALKAGSYKVVVKITYNNQSWQDETTLTVK